MIAALPMYDWPELTGSTNALWGEIGNRLREQGIAAPDFLLRSDEDEASWLAPDLLLGQTCGYPFSIQLKGKVTYVATPEYAVEGCKGANYSSAIIVNTSCDLSLQTMKGTAFAFNSTSSLSGYRCVREMVGEPDQYFSKMLISGGHRQSARMIADSTADIAAIDAVCWHMLQQFESETATQLKVIGWTKPHPALPFITSLETNSLMLEILRSVLEDVFSDQARNSNFQQLAITGCSILDPIAYEQLAEL